MWWSEDQQLPGTGAVDISLTENGLANRFRLPTADTTLPEHPLPPLTSFSAIVRRPLFTPDRREQPSVDPDQSPEVEEEEWLDSPSYPDVDFIGTVADGNGFRAFINDLQGVRSVAIGHEIGGWHVMMIDARRLTLERGMEKIILSILEGET